ncbi:type II secretion system F family protein [Desulfotruncus alcoholivorax]|uniref:type II secretion system F family protein n=1 Tax=Desulfotruncus alcoholivorax TaxID=265477 RepID=UPI0004239A17|nr:type II secretion system F family protein [Desulfotruncus alcoholivorax]
MPVKYVAVLVFISGLLLVLGLYRPSFVGEQEFSRRMAAILKKKEKDNQGKGTDRLNSVLNRIYQKLIHIANATPLKKWVEKELTRADLPLRGDEFLVFSCAAIGIATICALVFTGSLVMALMILVIFIPLPYLFIQRARARRLNKINAQIGDALLIIANSLRSGFSFLQAMDLVRKEMPDPIAKEFGRTFQEISLGMPTEQALQNMSERVDSDDLEMVVTAVLIQRQVGGNLAEVLDKIAYTIRERIRIKGEIKTLTAQGRISGLVIGLLPASLAVLLYIINPGYMSLLFTTRIGIVMVSAAVIAQTLGFLLIRKIVDIKY